MSLRRPHIRRLETFTPMPQWLRPGVCACGTAFVGPAAQKRCAECRAAREKRMAERSRAKKQEVSRGI